MPNNTRENQKKGKPKTLVWKAQIAFLLLIEVSLSPVRRVERVDSYVRSEKCVI